MSDVAIILRPNQTLLHTRVLQKENNTTITQYIVMAIELHEHKTDNILTGTYTVIQKTRIKLTAKSTAEISQLRHKKFKDAKSQKRISSQSLLIGYFYYRIRSQEDLQY